MVTYVSDEGKSLELKQKASMKDKSIEKLLTSSDNSSEEYFIEQKDSKENIKREIEILRRKKLQKKDAIKKHELILLL